MSRMVDELTRFAEVEVPAPRPAFVAGLGERLAELMADKDAIHVDLLPTVDDALLERASRTRRTGRFAAAVSIALVVVAIGVTRSATSDRSVHTANPAASVGVGGGATGTTDDDGALAASRAAAHRIGGVVAQVAPLDASRTEAAPFDGPLSSTGSAGMGVDSAVATEAPFGLRGTGTPARTLLDWDRYAGDDFGAYLVLRSAAPDDPAWPDASGRTLMLLRIENRDMTSHQDTGKVGTTPRYRVVVVDKEGKPVARSGVFQSDVAVNARELQGVRVAIS